MINFKYALKRIVNQPTTYVILFFQLIISSFLFLIAFDSTIEMTSSLNYAKKFMDRKDFSIITNEMDFDIFISRVKELPDISVAENAYNLIAHNTEFKAFLMCRTTTSIPKAESDRLFLGGEVDTIAINENVAEFNNFLIMEGRYFNADEFVKTCDYTAMVMGHYFKRYYSIGEKFEINGVVYKVVGFLEKNTIFNGYITSDFQNMDYSVLLPLEQFIYEGISDQKLRIQNVSLLNVIEAGGIYDIVKSDTLVRFKAELDSTSLYDLGFLNKNDEYLSYFNFLIQLITGYLVMFVTCIVFSGFGIVSSLNAYITKNKREFVIHMINGASNKDVQLSIIYQIVPTVVLSYICSISLLVGVVDKVDVNLFCLVFVILFLYTIIILLKPLLMIRRIDIVSTLGGEK